MTILIILSVIFILLWAFWYFVNKPLIYKDIPQKRLIEHLEALLFRGYDRGFIIIQVPTDKKFKRFIQFAKYIGDNKEVGIRFDYPLAEWSKPYYENLKLLLKRNRIEFVIEETNQERISEFIVIDIGKNIAKGSKISLLVLQKLYGLTSNDLVELYMVNISPKNEKIGF